MAKTNSHKHEINFLERKFHGSCDLLFAYSYLYFQKSGIAQKVIHHIKYEGRDDLAIEMGKRYGLELKPYVSGFEIEAIVPVPLHKKKLKIRGYNQSMKLAEGLSSSLEIPVIDGLNRNIETSTQTRKSRVQRWQNVESVFSLADHSVINKRVVLVDDVITTGATIESCAQFLINNGCEVGLISLASAK